MSSARPAVQFRRAVNPLGIRLFQLFDQNKRHAVNDQRDCNDNRVIQPTVDALSADLFENLIPDHADKPCRNATDDHLEPERPRLLFFNRCLTASERPQTIPEEDHHGKDCAELDDHLKHLPEFRRQFRVVGKPERQPLVQQNQMPGGTDGQPLGNALHDAVKQGFQKFDHHVRLLSPFSRSLARTSSPRPSAARRISPARTGNGTRHQ